jgi:hypothetical protein
MHASIFARLSITLSAEVTTALESYSTPSDPVLHIYMAPLKPLCKLILQVATLLRSRQFQPGRRRSRKRVRESACIQGHGGQNFEETCRNQI